MTARQDWRALSDRLTARQVQALEDVERAARGAGGTSGPLAVLAAVMADHNATGVQRRRQRRRRATRSRWRLLTFADGSLMVVGPERDGGYTWSRYSDREAIRREGQR